MIGDLKNYFKNSDLAVWGPDTATAQEVAKAFPLAKNVTVNPRLPDEKIALPSYLTLDGGGDNFVLEGRSVESLNDIQSVDELGRVIGMSGFHGRGHSLIGGTMSSFESPRNPQFYSWHGEIDSIIDQWKNNTKAGQNWFNSAAADGWHSVLDRDAESYANNYNFTSFCNASEHVFNPPTQAPSRKIGENSNHTSNIDIISGAAAAFATIAIVLYCARRISNKAARVATYQEVDLPPPSSVTNLSAVEEGAVKLADDQIIHR